MVGVIKVDGVLGLRPHSLLIRNTHRWKYINQNACLGLDRRHPRVRPVD